MTATPQTNTTLPEIAEVLRVRDDFAICGHVSPDGDCIGSQLALAHALRALGKKATCLLVRDEPLPASIAFMPGSQDMVAAERFDGTAKTFVCVDVPTRERIEQSACAILDSCEASITVDHHACDKTMCDYVYVDPDAASASMLVWELVKLLCEQPPLESAVCAYVGLATDTGGFRFQNSDARALRTAAELVECGVDPAHIAECAFQNRTMASLGLEGLAISRLQLGSDGKWALSWTSQQDFDQLGAVKSDAEPLIDLLRSLGGVQIACMLREQDGKVRGSLRSKGDRDVSVLAREFGGGGHKAAAGFTLDIPLEEARALLASKMSALVNV